MSFGLMLNKSQVTYTLFAGSESSKHRSLRIVKHEGFAYRVILRAHTLEVHCMSPALAGCSHRRSRECSPLRHLYLRIDFGGVSYVLFWDRRRN